MAISPQFNKLIAALRTALEIGDGTLDKEVLHMMTCLIPLDYLYSSGMCKLLSNIPLLLFRNSKRQRSIFVGPFISKFPP